MFCMSISDQIKISLIRTFISEDGIHQPYSYFTFITSIVSGSSPESYTEIGQLFLAYTNKEASPGAEIHVERDGTLKDISILLIQTNA